jgi:hypothetical protein
MKVNYCPSLDDEVVLTSIQYSSGTPRLMRMHMNYGRKLFYPMVVKDVVG